MKKFTLVLMMLFSLSVIAQTPFTEGNFVVFRAGDGTVDLTANGNKIFLDEYTPAGVLVRSIEIPSTGTGKCVTNGTNDTEGTLTRSPNGLYITFFGYDATAPHASSVLSAAPGTVNRMVTWLNNAATISYLPSNDYPAGGQAPRAAITTNGTDFWMASGSGIGYRNTSSSATTIVATITTPSPTSSFRTLTIADGDIYASTTIGTNNVRIGQIGDDLATTATTYNPLPGIETNLTPHQFAFVDLDATVPGVDVLYVCDESTGSMGGIRKYSLVAGTWTYNGKIGVGEKYRHLIVKANGSDVTIFSTKNGGNSAGGGGALVTVMDNTGYNVAPTGYTITELAAVANTSKIAYRGIAWAPVATALPLTLKSFNAAFNGTAVKLWWQTLNEVNTRDFTIERSTDGRTYSSAGMVAARNSTTAQDYTFTDLSPDAETGFYRLKMTDKDGSFRYSQVVRVTKSATAQLQVTPNPVNGSTLRLVHAKAGEAATVSILSNAGKLLQSHVVSAGATYSVISLTDLPAGVYYVQLIDGRSKQVVQFIKK